jgi:sulfite exporter TauE/SafE/copper chaperone CopZ
VDEVEVDEQQIRLTVFALTNYVIIPYLLEKRTRNITCNFLRCHDTIITYGSDICAIIYPEMATVTYPVKGMHCKACETLIDSAIGTLSGVGSARASLKDRSVTITSKKGKGLQSLPSEKTVDAALKELDYEVGYETEEIVTSDKFTWLVVLGVGAVIALVAYLFSVLKFDPLDSLATLQFGAAGFALVTGMVAGFSTCAALIGGLLGSVSAKYSEAHPELSAGQKFVPHLAFNGGRVVGFAVFGGLIGWAGRALAFAPAVTGTLSILAGLLMVVLGLQLTGLFPRLSVGVSLPRFLTRRITGGREDSSGAGSKYSHAGAVALGALSFLLPCGFTQTMQLYAVSTASPVQGALIMGLFALGTTPGLLTIGGLTSAINPNKTELGMRLFQALGAVVVAMALFTFSNGLALTGIPARLTELTSGQSPSAEGSSVAPSLGTTGADREQGINGEFALTYTKDEVLTGGNIQVKQGSKNKVTIHADVTAVGCMSAIMLPGLTDDGAKLLQQGKDVVIEFTASKKGTYNFTCAMGINFKGSRVTVT